MEVAGAAFPITPLLAQCKKITQILQDVGKKFKKAPFLMTSIGTECSLIYVALDQLLTFDWESIASYNDGRQEQMTRAAEAIILGCTLTLSVIDEYAMELQDYVESPTVELEDQAMLLESVKVLWKESEMKELLQQLRGYQSGLTNLLRAAHDETLEDLEESLGQGGNFVDLLQRSRASRSRKPLSIRAAMQQSATYSNLSRTNSSLSSVPSTGSSRQSKTGSYSSASSVAGASPAGSYGRPTSPSTPDGSNTSFPVKATKKPPATKKRPPHLALQPEEPGETVYDGQYVHTKRRKDQLRKSSPTCGDKFQFVPGVPPTNDDHRRYQGAPPKSKREYGRAMRDMSVMDALEVIEEPEEPEDEDEEVPLDEEVDKSEHDMNGNNEMPEEDEGSPSPSATDYDNRSPPASSPRSLRKENSSSSVRSQVHNLPESARLRKQASASKLQNQKQSLGSQQPAGVVNNRVQNMAWPRAQRHSPPSMNQYQHAHFHPTYILNPQLHPSFAHMPPSAYPPPSHRPPPVPPNMPTHSMTDTMDHNEVLTLPPRGQSLEALARRRGPADNASPQDRPNVYNQAPMPLRPRRSSSRSGSDGARPPVPKFAMPIQHEESDEDAPSHSSGHSNSPSSQIPPEIESWPLIAQAMERQEQYEEQYHKYRDQAPHHLHSRTTSANTSNSQRASAVNPSPKTSHNNTPSSGTPRQGRSRSNTLLAATAEGNDEQYEEESQTTQPTPSAAMATNWYPSPPDHFIPPLRASRLEPMHWEDGAYEQRADEPPPLQSKAPGRMRRDPPSLSVFPPRAPSRQIETQPYEQRPRSPQHTEKFLVNVKETIPEHAITRRSSVSEDALRRPSTATGFHSGGDEFDTANVKKHKPKKDPKFPMLGEMFAEYKGIGTKYYAYDDINRPSTGHPTVSSNASTLVNVSKDDSEVQPALRSPTAASVVTTHSFESGSTAKTPLVTTTNTNKPSSRRSVDTTGSGSSSQKSKDTNKSKKKKGKTFPSLSEMLKEYKELTNNWYTSPYAAERERTLTTPAGSR